MKKPQEKCLLIRMKDGREFLTRRKNVPQLVEFSKTFDAQLFFAEAGDDCRITDLPELPIALCNAMHRNPSGYSIQEVVPDKPHRRSRSEMHEIGKEITDYIRDQLLAGETVSLKGISQKFAVHQLSQPYLSSRLAIVRLMLHKQGIPIQRIGPGKYRQFFMRSPEFKTANGEIFSVFWAP